MTSRFELEQQRNAIGEIREIMNSMKTLAYMETRKLARFLDAQHSVVEHIESMAADFLSFHPALIPTSFHSQQISLLIGAERGFCGAFNEMTLAALDLHQASEEPETLMILVGHKLCNILEDDPRVSTYLDGVSVVEEVEKVLIQIIEAIETLQSQYDHISLSVYYHDPDIKQVVVKGLLPPFRELSSIPPRFSNPPLLNLPPQNFLTELVDQYLFATLHEIIFTSLMAENQQRVQHLEGAVQHLEEKSEQLLSQSNALRQEEIIEDIEIILLGTAGLDNGEQDVEENSP